MTMIQFNIHKNFHIHTEGWGQAQLQDIIKLLDSVISDFYPNFILEMITDKQVYIQNSKYNVPQISNPQIFKQDGFNQIFLNTSDNLWSQYTYQFSHELCHHVIDSNFSMTNDKFGWLEESLCELASIFCLDKMSQTWQINPPFLNWKDYSTSFAKYVTDIIKEPENIITNSFNNWFKEKLDTLYKDRYNREINRIIALQLFPLFKNNPDSWRIIQYLKFIKEPTPKSGFC